MADGTIRAREARDVVADLLRDKKVSKAVYKLSPRRLTILVGSRQVEIPLGSGLSFYALQNTLSKVNAAVDDLNRSKEHRNQVDLEELIGAK